VKGFEFEGAWAPDRLDRFDLSATFLDAHYSRYLPLTTVDFSGRPLDRSPRFTVSAGYTLTLAVGEGGRVSASLRSRWTDHYVLSDFAAAIQYPQAGFTTTDATVEYGGRHGAWFVRAYVHNIENTIALTGVTGYIAGPGGYGTIGEPRTVGLSAGFHR